MLLLGAPLSTPPWTSAVFWIPKQGSVGKEIQLNLHMQALLCNHLSKRPNFSHSKPSKQVSLQSYFPRKKICLSQTNGWDFSLNPRFKPPCHPLFCLVIWVMQASGILTVNKLLLTWQPSVMPWLRSLTWHLASGFPLVDPILGLFLLGLDWNILI